MTCPFCGGRPAIEDSGEPGCHVVTIRIPNDTPDHLQRAVGDKLGEIYRLVTRPPTEGPPEPTA